MKLNIEPYICVGPIKFDLLREKIHAIIKSPFIQFEKTTLSRSLTDSYDELGLHVFYDESDRCEAVEIFTISDLLYRNAPIFDKSHNENLKYLDKIDSSTEKDDVSIISYSLGLSIFSETGIYNPDSKINSVLVFRKGYYD